MKKRALFVGVDEYEDGSIADLEYAVEDAYGLASAFETLLGFDRVERLRNPRGKKDILRKVRELTAGLGKGDLFFFFFAGHGFRVKDNHVLVCAEDEYRYLEDEDDGLRMGLLKAEARGLPSPQYACRRSGKKRKGNGGRGRRRRSRCRAGRRWRWCGVRRRRAWSGSAFPAGRTTS
ncbi:MAG: caspase family protein [Kiritimatiellae bacterium]|nr:caspase family protein [Kiritimatiellia bacterium]